MASRPGTRVKVQCRALSYCVKGQADMRHMQKSGRLGGHNEKKCFISWASNGVPGVSDESKFQYFRERGML